MSEPESESECRAPVIECREELLRAATRLLGSREAAEDVVQEALLRLVERATPAPEVPGAWLRRVTRNLAVDRLRRARLERMTASGTSFDGTGAPVSPDETLELETRCREAIRALLDGSSDRDVAAVLLREVFGTDYAEIAELGGRSAAACRQGVHRALERARDRVRENARVDRMKTRPSAPDAVLDRFAHAVLDADRHPLLDALRVGGSVPADAVGRDSGDVRSASAWTRVDVEGTEVRFSLVLDGVTLCALVAGEDGLVRCRSTRAETSASV